MRELELAVRLRDEFEVQSGGTRFLFKVTMADGAVPIDEVFILEPTDGVECPRLAQEERPGFEISTFRLKTVDHERMFAAAELLNKLKEESTGGNDLTFQAMVETRLKEGIEAPETFSLTIYARTHHSVEFSPLGEEKIIRPTDPEAGELFS